MRTLLRLVLVAAVAGATALAPSPAHADDRPRVLVLTEGTADADAAEYAIERLEMEARRWRLDVVEAGASDLADLSGTDVVMMLNTHGEVLDADQRDSLREFVEHGGGLLATHAAAEAEPDWAWLRGALGAEASSPRPSEAPSLREVAFNTGSPITAGLDDDLELTERWYDFVTDPEASGQNLLAVDDDDRPIAWNSLDQRVFYTAAGGQASTWGERDFLQLIRQAIWWSAGERGDLVQYTADTAPAWPYTWTFALFVLAVAGGGSLAVWRLDRTDRPRRARAAPGSAG